MNKKTMQHAVSVLETYPPTKTLTKVQIAKVK